MRRFCADNGGYMDGGWAPNYGYVIDTPNYRYCLRCIPMKGDYNAYLTFYDRQTLEQYLASQNQEAGSMGGWDCPGTDSANYENGEFVPPEQEGMIMGGM